MKFQITYEIRPSGHFGVPQDGRVVVPGKDGGGQYQGDSYHAGTLTRVGYGSMSQYRAENQAIVLSVTLGKAYVRLKDNFAFLEVEAPNSGTAYELAEKEITTFLQHLSLSQGTLYTCRPLIIESDDRQNFPIPKVVAMTSFTAYNLERLKSDILNARNYHGLTDPRLKRALQYFAHARYLFERRMEIADPLSGQFTLLIASIFLNLWKAITAVIGDPSQDKDYQKRYRQLGFDQEFFETKIEKIRDLRNNYDVAHYSLTEERIKDIEASLGEAHKIVTEVLRRYRDNLVDKARFP